MSLQRLKEQEDQLCDSKFDLEFDIFEKLGSLIQAKWDSNSLKFDLSKMLSEHEKISVDLYDVWDEIKVLEDKK
ncbi:MAG: hypothetical protein KJI69_04500 [Patescibacteria group bacterium]|nr:hypothetical protein [Patescibacteria group bacterium]